MDIAICKERSISFWDLYAKWYDLWVKHNDFHRSIIELLFRLVEPDWQILDIGAGNGVLSIPLVGIGCNVTAIEPSCGMRDLLYKNIVEKEIQNYNVDTRRWEDIPLLSYQNINLVIACNSLHLMEMPFEMAIKKVFSLDAQNVLIVTELEKIKEKLVFDTKRYELKIFRTYFADTSFAYHSIFEAFDHYETRLLRRLTEYEKKCIIKELIFEKGHYWKKEETLVGIYYFSRK